MEHSSKELMSIYLRQRYLMIHMLGFTNLALLLKTYDAAVNSSPCYQDRSISALFNKARVVVTFCLSDLYIFFLPRELLGVLLSSPGITPEQSPFVQQLVLSWSQGYGTKKYHQAPTTGLEWIRDSGEQKGCFTFNILTKNIYPLK